MQTNKASNLIHHLHSSEQVNISAHQAMNVTILSKVLLSQCLSFRWKRKKKVENVNTRQERQQ